MGTYDTIGGTPRHDPMFDEDPPCEICGKDSFDCECPECPICRTTGRPKCYGLGSQNPQQGCPDRRFQDVESIEGFQEEGEAIMKCPDRSCRSNHIFSQPIRKTDEWFYKCLCLICGKNWEEKIELEEEVQRRYGIEPNKR